MKLYANSKKIGDGEVQIVYGNRLFVSENVSLLPDFVKVINESFDDKIKQVNFVKQVEAANVS